MKTIQVILSPNFSEDEFYDNVSGITFKGGRHSDVHQISLEEDKLEGIQRALRKNILIPFDKASLELVNGNKIVKDEPVVVEEVVGEPKKEEPKKKEALVEEVKEEKPEPKKAPAKKTPAKKPAVKKAPAKKTPTKTTAKK